MTEARTLRSHPHLQLHEHIEQLQQAFLVLQKSHSPATISAKVQDLFQIIAVLHDVGKATTCFQDYIKDPDGYRGNNDDKAHTPLSLFLTLLLLAERQYDPLQALCIAVAVGGHHSYLPILPDNRIGQVSDAGKSIGRFFGGNTARVIKEQLSTLDFAALRTETGIDFTTVASKEELQQNFIRYVSKITKYLNGSLIKLIRTMEQSPAVAFRLSCQLVYSLLLEADKALLAVSNPENYLRQPERRWSTEWVDRCIGTPKITDTNHLRHTIRQQVLEAIATKNEEAVFSLTAPTGAGKTLLAAAWALGLQEKQANYRKIIIVLPFLSIIDQTTKKYEELLSIGDKTSLPGWLMTSHSLSERSFDSEIPLKDNSFLVDTWRSALIITTYDQFLLALMEPRAKYQMRFHNLCDALIVIDEVQSIPCRLWRPLAEILRQLTQVGHSKLLLMSATLPPFMDAQPLLERPDMFFRQCRRYSLALRLEEPLSITDFCAELEGSLAEWLETGQRVLLTFNTRKSARKIRDFIDGCIKQYPEHQRSPLYFISADVTPKDRLDFIEKIKSGGPCIVVSTQCIEAGVDIDMDRVIRDFGPLDCLIQIAGRCNREGEKPRGVVEIIDLIDDETSERFSDWIYDPIHLAATRTLLTEKKGILEEDIFPITAQYFAALSKAKDTGLAHLEKFARWQEDIPVHEMLRGKERLQYTFLVMEQDAELERDIMQVTKIENQFERREGWRKLAGRIARISVSLWAKQGFKPESIANERYGQWVLRQGYYKSSQGLLVEGYPQIF